MVRRYEPSLLFGVGDKSSDLKVFDKRKAKLLESFALTRAGWTVRSGQVEAMFKDVREAISNYIARVQHEQSIRAAEGEIRKVSRDIANQLNSVANSLDKLKPVHKSRVTRFAQGLPLAAVLNASSEVPRLWQGPNAAFAALTDSLRHLASDIVPSEVKSKQPRIESGPFVDLQFGRPPDDQELALVAELAVIWIRRTGRPFDTSNRMPSDTPITAMKFVEVICAGAPVKLQQKTVQTLVRKITAEMRQKNGLGEVKKKPPEKVSNS